MKDDMCCMSGYILQTYETTHQNVSKWWWRYGNVNDKDAHNDDDYNDDDVCNVFHDIIASPARVLLCHTCRLHSESRNPHPTITWRHWPIWDKHYRMLSPNTGFICISFDASYFSCLTIYLLIVPANCAKNDNHISKYLPSNIDRYLYIHTLDIFY